MTLPKLFTFVEQENIAPGSLDEQLKAMQDDLFTGIARFTSSSGKTDLALFTRGQLVTLYDASTDGVQRVYPKTWLESAADSKEALTFQSMNLNVQDLRILKIILESRLDLSTPIEEVSSTIASVRARAFPTVLVMDSEEAQSYQLFPGMDGECQYNLFLSHEKFVRSAGDLLFTGEEEILWRNVQRIQCENSTLAWTEMLQHQIFTEWLLKLFSVYESLKGRLYLNQIIKSINFKATANDWMLSVNAKNVNDQVLFNSPEEATKVYSELLAVIVGQFISDIGETIYDSLYLDFSAKLIPVQSELLTKIASKTQSSH